jgi:hypothetical protein
MPLRQNLGHDPVDGDSEEKDEDEREGHANLQDVVTASEDDVP